MPRILVHLRKKNHKTCERLKTHVADTKQASEPESNMVGILELSDQKFLKTIIKILRALMKKIGNMQKHLNNVNREMKILRKIKKLMLEKKKL